MVDTTFDSTCERKTFSIFDETDGQEFLFSVIMPVYNTADYVNEAIESIVGQTVGFERYIQLVLVNDGSTDGSGEICASWQRRFPHNIVFVDKPNEGASTARNVALSLCRGDYVNCLDSDDYWSLNAFECAGHFFLEHPDVGICACRHAFFGAREGDHPLSYKYEVDDIINLHHVVDFPQLSLSNAFVLRELVKPEYFDDRLSVSEDFLVVSRILLKEMRYGVLAKPTYWYRKREGGDSAIDASSTRISWYMDTPRFCYRRLFDESKAQFGCVMPHVQYAIMYDLQWRLKNRLAFPLNSDQLVEYRRVIDGLLAEIDDEIVISQRNLTPAQKLYVLGLKHGQRFDEMQGKLSVMGDTIICQSPSAPLRVSNAVDHTLVHVDFIRRDDDGIQLEGRLGTFFPIDRVRLVARCSACSYEARLFPRTDRYYDAFFDRKWFTEAGFELCIPWKGKRQEIEFLVVLDSHALPAELELGKFCPLSMRRFDFAILGNMSLLTVGRAHDRLAIAPVNPAALAKRESLFEAAIWYGRPDVRESLKWRQSARSRQLTGLVAGGALPHSGKEVWLISDRPAMAGDNGEALFAYLSEHPIPNVKPYFVLDACSPDFERMKSYGTVVAYGSDEHIKLHLHATKIISSIADDFVFSRLEKRKFLLKGLCQFDFVFLQHGVTKDDMSGWLNRYKKNIALLCCASVTERNSFLENPAYSYGPEQVRVTGFPRHDLLMARAAAEPVKRKILVAPTWRESISGALDETTGMRAENPAFERSEYYQFYQGLINNGQLQKACEQHGYEVEFLMHPAFFAEIEKFSSPFAHIATDYDYQGEFVSSAILITDYSSVAFDFALLRKPVVYAQFDQKEFYSIHAWEPSYFDYARDGFGPVCLDLNSIIEALIELMKAPCLPEMPKEYRQRADAFFFEPEGDCRCATVVDAILDIDRKRL